jgi:hypothetical protein
MRTPTHRFDRPEGLLEAHLAEYEALTAELTSRFESQRQAFNYLVLVLGGTVALLGGAVGQQPMSLLRAPEVFFWLPLVTAPLAFIFFDNELMIWSIIWYVRHHLRLQVQAAVGSDRVWLMEESRFRYLNRFCDPCHRLLSYGRWLFFLFPVALSTWLAFAELSRRSYQDGVHLAVLGMDVVVTAFLMVAMVQAGREQGRWRRRDERRAVGPAAHGTPRLPLGAG